MDRIIEVARSIAYHTIVACIVPPNAASFGLHEKLGFVHAGTIREAGFKFGEWRDITWLQLIL